MGLNCERRVISTNYKNTKEDTIRLDVRRAGEVMGMEEEAHVAGGS